MGWTEWKLQEESVSITGTRASIQSDLIVPQRDWLSGIVLCTQDRHIGRVDPTSTFPIGDYYDHSGWTNNWFENISLFPLQWTGIVKKWRIASLTSGFVIDMLVENIGWMDVEWNYSGQCPEVPKVPDIGYNSCSLVESLTVIAASRARFDIAWNSSATMPTSQCNIIVCDSTSYDCKGSLFLLSWLVRVRVFSSPSEFRDFRQRYDRMIPINDTKIRRHFFNHIEK